MNIKKNAIIAMLVLFSVVLPLGVGAASKKYDGPECVPLITSDLVGVGSKPTIRGTASSTVKSVKVVFYKEGSDKVFAKSKTAKTKKCGWKAKMTKKLPEGVYKVEVVASSRVITQGTVTVGDADATSASHNASNVSTGGSKVAVSPIALLSGGNARAGTTVPISYLQLENIGNTAALVKGFWIKQNGNASTNSVIGLTAVDDKELYRGSVGGVEGSVLFANNQAFAPIEAILAPGEMKLFTIKAILTGNGYAHMNKQLMLDVVGVDGDASVQATFPIKGTTWTITQ